MTRNQWHSCVVVPLETHFHMDFGLGVANTLLAVAEGVEVIQTTVTGIGERAGNTPMEETVLALLTMYGLDAGIRTERFFELSKLVMDLAGVDLAGRLRELLLGVGERLRGLVQGPFDQAGVGLGRGRDGQQCRDLLVHELEAPVERRAALATEHV